MSLIDSYRAAVITRVAAQWTALGGRLTEAAETTVIDLDALVAMTAGLGQADARVLDVALEWCVVFGHAINPRRLRTVARDIGATSESVGALAATVAASGGPRWGMAGEPLAWPGSRNLVHVTDLTASPRLGWRLRELLGANARADVLTVLVAEPERGRTIGELAAMCRYSKRNVALAVEPLLRSGTAETDRFAKRERVRLARDPALRRWLVGDGQAVRRLDWVARFRIALAVLGFLALHPGTGPSELARSIEARALVERLRAAISEGDLPRPDTSALGAAFGPAFDDWVTELAGTFGSIG